MPELFKSWTNDVSLLSLLLTAGALAYAVGISRRQSRLQAALAELEIEEKLGVISVRCRMIEHGDATSIDYNDAVLYLCGDTCALLAVHRIVSKRNYGEYMGALKDARRLVKLASDKNTIFLTQLTKIDDEAAEKGIRLKDAL